MKIILEGDAGDGNIITKNWSDFSFKLRNTDENFYMFDVSFFDSLGHFAISLKENNYIDESSTLDINFEKSLGIYNDKTLYDVAKKMLASINVQCK